MMKRIKQWVNEYVAWYNHTIQRQIDLGMVISVEDRAGYVRGRKEAYVVVGSRRVKGGRELSLGRVWASPEVWDNADLVDVDERDSFLVGEVTDEAIAERMEAKQSYVTLFIADKDIALVELNGAYITSNYGGYDAEVSLNSRTVKMPVSHVRQASWATDLKTNADAMMCEDFWHATIRTNWGEKIKTAHNGELMIHAGTREAALDRILLAHDDADEIDLYRIRINKTARVMETFVQDQGDGWHEDYSHRLHHGFNAFAYINEHEDCESTSIYIQATAIDVVNMETLTMAQVKDEAENAPEALNGRNTGRLVAA